MENKTKPNDASVAEFLNSVENEIRRADSLTLLELMKQITRQEPKMWGDSIVGFGAYHYKSASGREGDWFLTGFSPRKQSMSIYIMAGFEKFPELMSRLGKFKTGRGCLYVNRLDDIDIKALKQLIRESYLYMKQAYR